MPAAILIIDDEADDAAMIKRTVLSLRPKSPVYALTGSKELRNYLDGEGPYADRKVYPLPGLILLDLRMPEINGLEVLEWLKADPKFSAIPVIVISSFDRQRDIKKSYQLGACTFLSKPINPMQFRAVIRGLKVSLEFDD